MTELLQLIVNGLVEGSVYALGAAGISLVFGPLRIVNFAQGDYLTFGAFAAVLANVTWRLDMVSSTLFALLATAALAVVLEFVLWRPMRRRGAKTMSLFITSIGLAFILRASILFVSREQRARVPGERLPVLLDRRHPGLRATADLDCRRADRDRRDRAAAGADELRPRHPSDRRQRRARLDRRCRRRPHGRLHLDSRRDPRRPVRRARRADPELVRREPRASTSSCRSSPR